MDLRISKKELWVSKNELWISKNEFWISINELLISINRKKIVKRHPIRAYGIKRFLPSQRKEASGVVEFTLASVSFSLS